MKSYDLNGKKTTDLLNTEGSPFYINKDSEVLLVGPGALFIKNKDRLKTPPMDMNLITIPLHLSSGSITILDLPSMDGQSGFSSIKNVAEQLSYWDILGAELSDYIFILGNILDSPASLNKYDVIIDHMTWKSIGGTDSFSVLGDTYNNLLKDNGKAFCFFDMETSKEFKILKKALIDASLSCSTYTGLTDKYIIKDPVILNDLRDRDFEYKIIDKNVLEPWHRAKGILLAQKHFLN